jgi:hypothetical protein
MDRRAGTTERRLDPEGLIMSTTRNGGLAWLLPMVLAVALIASPAARAQFPGYGMGFGYPAYGYGGYGYPGFGMGYGMGYGYGFPGYGLGYPGLGYGVGGYGMGYGIGGPGYGYAAGFPAVLPYGGPMAFAPYANPMFGLGMTPLGTQSYFTESNTLGRAQLSADRRARARELLRYGR